ncbi:MULTISPECIES: SCO3374 family protein [unclassified Streptomyces]|uniref:SCO3374 family protein n=1 Tax=unclassified Streptomyces TaxID=2593676 RepID=UPI0022562482|nr:MULTISPECIES: SCO3374 family protein [unclassified Streptomyces]MCX4916152.1 SCO3374 family protein [Streptomyces sp. NBC_00687]MCX5131747.1 SCO3374 family protein [Streptomyces sp. NBC_00340]WSD78381.1 SCO3374 family protein [Streptomyces sp. NBC_01558]
MVPTVPLPRRPLDPGDPVDPVQQWYENELGWATVPGPPARLVTGVLFDVLEGPAEAGFAALRHLGPGSPVVLHGDRMGLLVAAGSAEELPGLLDWLEWGGLALDLTAVGEGGSVEAPPPPGPRAAPAGGETREGPRGAARWLRPPEPGCAVRPALPTLSALGGGAVGGGVGGAPDLVRVVQTMATQCHRVRLGRVSAQPLTSSYFSRIDAGTRPRSLTS